MHNRLATYLSDTNRKYTAPILSDSPVPPVIVRQGMEYRLVLVVTVPVAVPVPVPSPIS